MARSDFFNRKTIAWAFYDWANSAFALSVLAVLFPLFLGSYWSAGDAGTVVTERLGWITAGASAIVFLIAPIFGTIADAGGYRKRFLFILGSLGAITTAALGAVGEGDWVVAGALYTLAELPGGTLFSTTFDPQRYYPIVKEQTIRFRRPATSDLTVEMTMTPDEAAAIAAAADAEGKADYERTVEILDAAGTVVAISANLYQMRTHGS